MKTICIAFVFALLLQGCAGSPAASRESAPAAAGLLGLDEAMVTQQTSAEIISELIKKEIAAGL